MRVYALREFESHLARQYLGSVNGSTTVSKTASEGSNPSRDASLLVYREMVITTDFDSVILGSNPSRPANADVAQSVERRLGKAEVTGSIPVISSF